MTFVLRLHADRLDAGATLDLAAGAVRAVYVEAGHVNAAAFGTVASLAANSAWFGASMASLHAGAEGARLLRLETGIHNHEALSLYPRAGFHRRGPFADYGPDPVSIFMEKDLTSATP